MNRRPFLVALVFLLLLVPQLAAEETKPTAQAEYKIYPYRMKGKVRLLFFWVGKDDVGGGHISVGQKPAANGLWEQQFQVLFGSNPERVPGGINRWGFGRESATWSGPPGSHQATLRQTLFEGFMKHSKEDSLSEVQRNNDRANQDQQHFYDGIQSRVTTALASSEIRTFAYASDFKYSDSAPIHCAYQERLKAGPPDRSKKMSRLEAGYEAPLGFLSAVNDSIQTVLAQYRQDPKKFESERPSRRYVYNAKSYQLSVRKLKLLEKFEVEASQDDRRQGAENWSLQRVVRAEFRIKNLQSGDDHDFTLWFPTEGPFSGVPVRIVDKPRWWLRVELNLEREEVQRLTTDPALTYTANCTPTVTASR